jgi:LuxR family quorum-sensing system transcriptional regulator CciR
MTHLLSKLDADLILDPSDGGAPAPHAEFLDPCTAVQQPEVVFDQFRSTVENLGYDILALIPVTPAARQAMGLPEIGPAIGANVPPEWVQHYFTEGYQLYDPVLLQTPQQDQPLIWDELLRHAPLSPKQKRVLQESRDAGIHNGVSIPLHGPRGETYVVSLGSERPMPGGPRELSKLHLLSIQFLLSYSRALRQQASEPLVRITDRERECLTWTARGKSAWTIGKILGVSEHTVNFHLKRCMGKLGATNRMQAVVAAVRLGLILP